MSNTISILAASPGSHQVSKMARMGRPELKEEPLQLHSVCPPLHSHPLPIHSEYSRQGSQELFLKIFTLVIAHLVPEEKVVP